MYSCKNGQVECLYIQDTNDDRPDGNSILCAHLKNVFSSFACIKYRHKNELLSIATCKLMGNFCFSFFSAIFLSFGHSCACTTEANDWVNDVTRDDHE